MVKFKQLVEKLLEGVIYICGTLSTVIVLFIIYFLFKEGSGIFSKKQIEEGYSIVVNQHNSVTKIKPSDIKLIFSNDISNWKQIGGNYDSIYTFTLSDVEYKFTSEQLGENYEFLNQRIAEYITANTGVIALFPDKYLDSKLPRVPIDNITMTDILAGQDWYPNSTPIPSFGALPILMGSLWVSIGAMILALPLGLIIAIYLSEIAGPFTKDLFRTIIELLSGIPSVVYGFFGLVIVVPFLKSLFNLDVGETALAGSVILAIISLPTIISLSEDAITSVPGELKAASLALGANHWQTISRVIVPHASSGIISATILGMGRAFGETMAVLMVTGNAAMMPTTFLQPVRTITATIAAELGEAPSGGLHYESLFILGCILFIFTFLLNLVAGFFTVKKI
ncbi:MAG: phosphate ABC transporter permease subunit PstC [Bacteroidota bacterium]|nr:phosphate ABC transporter permease subunit PstC [Bacteroidota bacterium]